MGLLLARGAQAYINVRDFDRVTTLHSAVVLGYKGPVRVLFKNGTNTESLDGTGWTTQIPLESSFIVSRLLVIIIGLYVALFLSFHRGIKSLKTLNQSSTSR